MTLGQYNDLTILITLPTLSAANHIIVQTISLFLNKSGLEDKYNYLLMIIFGILLVLVAHFAGVDFAHSTRKADTSSNIAGVILLGLIVAGGTQVIKTGAIFLQSFTDRNHQK